MYDHQIRSVEIYVLAETVQKYVVRSDYYENCDTAEAPALTFSKDRNQLLSRRGHDWTVAEIVFDLFRLQLSLLSKIIPRYLTSVGRMISTFFSLVKMVVPPGKYNYFGFLRVHIQPAVCCTICSLLFSTGSKSSGFVIVATVSSFSNYWTRGRG